MKLLLKIPQVRSRFGFLDETEGIGYLGAQNLMHQLRLFDFHIVRQAQLSAHLYMRPGQELRSIEKKETGAREGKRRVSIEMKPPSPIRRLNHHGPSSSKVPFRAGGKICLGKTKGAVTVSKEQVSFHDRPLAHCRDRAWILTRNGCCPLS